jgi:zinc protease
LRGEILADLKEADQDTQHVAYREFRKLCYPEMHPYHRLSDGTASSIKGMTLDQLRTFHTLHFRPDAMTIIVVGSLHVDQVISKIDRTFGKWHAKGNLGEFVVPDAPPIKQIARKSVQLAGKTQADIVLGYPGLRRTNPDYYALMVGDLIFGHLGLYGRLGANVRDRQGLAYYVFSSVEAGTGAGPWTVRAGVNPKNLDRAVDGILAEIERLRSDPVSQDEFGEACDFLTGSLALRLETNDGVASTLSDIELFGLGLDYLQRYPDIIRSLTPEQILAITRKYARPEKYALAIAGPATVKNN